MACNCFVLHVGLFLLAVIVSGNQAFHPCTIVSVSCVRSSLYFQDPVDALAHGSVVIVCMTALILPLSIGCGGDNPSGRQSVRAVYVRSAWCFCGCCPRGEPAQYYCCMPHRLSGVLEACLSLRTSVMFGRGRAFERCFSRRRRPRLHLIVGCLVVVGYLSLTHTYNGSGARICS